MTCEQVREAMCDYLEGNLTGDVALSFSSHLAECQACRQEADELRATLDWLRQAEDVTPPEDLRNSVLQRIEVEFAPKKRCRLSTDLTHAVAAAAIFLVLVAGNLTMSFRPVGLLDSGGLKSTGQEMMLSQPDVGEEEVQIESEIAQDQEIGSRQNNEIEDDAANDEPIDFFALTEVSQPAAGDNTQKMRFYLNILLIPLFALFTFIAVLKRRKA